MNLLERMSWGLIGRRQFHYIGYIESRTIWTSKGNPTSNYAIHNYSLYENIAGERRVEIYSEYESYARDHPMYVRAVVPWKNGHQSYEFAKHFIPKQRQGKHNVATKLRVVK